MQEGLNRLDLTFEKLDLQLVIDRYAVPGREELTFADFESMIMPKSPVFRMDMATRKVRKELSQESKQLLKKLLRKLIDSESEIEVLRERVRNHTNEEQRGLYDLLDRRDRGFLTTQEWEMAYEIHRDWLLPCGIKPNFELLVCRLARDKAAAKVTFGHFLEEIRMKSLKFYA